MQGQLPIAIKMAMQFWFDRRDWNFQRGFYHTGIACAENAKNIFDGWWWGIRC